MGVIAIKVLARCGLMKEEERVYPRCWYYLIHDDPEFARLALNFTASRPMSTTVPPGDIRLFRLALDIMERQGGKCNLLSAAEIDLLAEESKKVKHTLF